MNVARIIAEIRKTASTEDSPRHAAYGNTTVGELLAVADGYEAMEKERDALRALRQCTCGGAPRVSREDGTWIECNKGDEGCGDIVWASTLEHAKKLWNESA